MEQSNLIYEKAVDLIKKIYHSAEGNQPLGVARIQEAVKKITCNLSAGDSGLISLTAQYSEEDYLWTHSVNVCIFSVLAGLGLEYDTLRLEEVGLAGILHDAGMIKTAHIIQQPQKLTEEEYEQLKEKPFYGAEILDKIHDLDQSVIYIAREHHCYRDIKELPRNEETQNARLNEYTRITRLADIYDVMSHPRSGNRSEERRVGKECRSRWSPDH